MVALLMTVAKTLAHENAVLAEGGKDALYALEFVAIDDDLYFLQKCSLFRSCELANRKAAKPSRMSAMHRSSCV